MAYFITNARWIWEKQFPYITTTAWVNDRSTAGSSLINLPRSRKTNTYYWEASGNVSSCTITGLSEASGKSYSSHGRIVFSTPNVEAVLVDLSCTGSVNTLDNNMMLRFND